MKESFMNKKQASPLPESVGYPHLEELLGDEKFDELNTGFAEMYKKLQIIREDSSGGIKKQKEAKKAMLALEKTTDLIKELLQLKYKIIQQQEEKKA
jgi:hypothetical protein